MKLVKIIKKDWRSGKVDNFMKKHKYNIDCPCQECEEQWRKETKKKFQGVIDMDKKRKGDEKK